MKQVQGLNTLERIFRAISARFGLEKKLPERLDYACASHVPFSLRDWQPALKAAVSALSENNLPLLSAGVAFYSTLAFFPLMAAIVAIVALMNAPEQMQSIVMSFHAFLPKDVADLIFAQLQALASRRSDNILAAVVAIVISLFSASGATKHLVAATNIAYGIKDKRGWLRQQLEGLGWTAAGVIFGFIVMTLLIVNNTIIRWVGVAPSFADTLLYGRWIIIMLTMVIGLAVFYRYGPSRVNARWQWISWGGVTATILWLAGTALFFLFVQNFGNIGSTYSLFAGIVILMIWLNLTAFMVLFGAAVNYRLERMLN